ncbi:amino acid transporter [Trypanosoma conorhini]|uniref:Amino acid transporter n=1 Tax=Trypanosoma conorhini TaxID=83891 RepID=A0A422MVT7_9TRYP|nr:amino acid transporter [Trypanosoma conorhini]RNE97323.1 amino acid transporter [Trypanosoma conorhini]
MQGRSVGRFTLHSAIAMLLSLMVRVLTGIFGYLDFGSRATVSALLLYDPVKEPAAMVAYIGVLVKLCASYPLLTMVTRNSLYHSFGWHPGTPPFWRHCIFVVGLAVASLLCGLFIPNINTVFGLIGALCGGISGFILPALLIMYGGNWSLRSAGFMHYTLTHFLLIAGVTMAVFGTCDTIYSVVSGD